ncbi:tryptophan synthase beta subunit-like PLP-dependent enzyme [Melanomma pulvis-pyrius CBS 109.77]|uniref:Tryptophan synthase beta subunit-like PLP-dependent enzyme n=1 Tax=Melanomma pulvis-pyrius CBS 109.77 TaxID=1314802 RepID=A0A6A6XVV9_9PLEO|nr:tryptophan synthase beta subunit-like PLP-dependent enzyme [Melanomma pulvis-pyrius CBS 109.77]
MFFNAAASSWKYDWPSFNPVVENFHRRLPEYNVTPLVGLPEVAKELGLGHVFVKDESNRLGLPAFKILGASWAIYKAAAANCKLPLTVSLEELGAAARAQGLSLVACTAGNWGRAVSRMARYLQVPATIFVPKTTDRATQDKIASEGATVIVVDGDYDVSIQVARQEAEKENSLLVMDTSWEGYEEIPQWVVEGYSTMLTETDRQLEKLSVKSATHAIASVGVGSWAQAVSMHYKAKDPPGVVIAVEPDAAACLKASLEAGKMTPVVSGRTIMNGMCCNSVSYTAWEVLRDGVDASVEMSDAEAHQDLQYLHSQGIKNGPCGAAPLSALKRLCKEKKLDLNEQSMVVLFSTEGARDYIVPE